MESQARGFAASFVFVVRVLTWFVATIAWAVLGLVFWIPFLARMIAVFCVSVIAAAFLTADSRHVEAGLDFAIDFYVLGFRVTNRILERPEDRRGYYLPEFDPQAANLGTLLWNLLYTMAFWVAGYLMWVMITGGWHAILARV